MDRYGITEKAIKFIEKLNVPFAIMAHDKSVISIEHKNYLGFYSGALSEKGVRELIEGADLVIKLGDAFWSDFNTSGFTTSICCSKMLNLAPLFVKDSNNYIDNIFLGELLDILNKQIKAKNYKPKFTKGNSPVVVKANSKDNKLALLSFYEHLLEFVEKSDVLFVETGSSSLNFFIIILRNYIVNQNIFSRIEYKNDKINDKI